MDVSVNTVSKLLVDAGIVADVFNDKHIKNAGSTRIQLDEQWSFIYTKDITIKQNRILGNPDRASTVWLWTALDPESKSILTWRLHEDRTEEQVFYFAQDLRKRLVNRVQISTDGNFAYQRSI